MPDQPGDQLRHLFVEGRVAGHGFTNPQRTPGPAFPFPVRDRATHADRLLRQLEAIRRRAQQIQQDRLAVGLASDFGLLLEFASDPEFPLKAESLERRRSGIQLLNLRTVQARLPDGRTLPIQLATVRVPYGKLDVLQRLIDSYRSSQSPSGAPRHQELINSIAEIREAAVEAFWTEQQA